MVYDYIKRNEAIFGNKYYMIVQSKNMVMARRRNKLEDELLGKKKTKLVGEANKVMVKLCKDIYKTNVQLNDTKRELRRNKLETIYKSYNVNLHAKPIKKKEISDKINLTEKNEKSEKDNNINDNIIHNKYREDSFIKIDRNREQTDEFFAKIFTKSEHDLEQFSSVIPKSDSASIPDNNVSTTVKKKRVILNNKFTTESSQQLDIESSESQILEKSQNSEVVTANKDFSTSDITSFSTFTSRKNLLSAKSTIGFEASSSLNKQRNKRSSSLPKLSISYVELEGLKSIKKVDEPEVESKTVLPEVIKNKIQSLKEKKQSVKDEVKLVSTTDRLYNLSLKNLDEKDSRIAFAYSYDEWNDNLNKLKQKHREIIQRNRVIFRNNIQTALNYQNRMLVPLNSKAYFTRYGKRMVKNNEKSYDMREDAKLFEWTHKNIQELIVKKFNDSTAKKHQMKIKNYLTKFDSPSDI